MQLFYCFFSKLFNNIIMTHNSQHNINSHFQNSNHSSNKQEAFSQRLVRNISQTLNWNSNKNKKIESKAIDNQSSFIKQDTPETKSNTTPYISQYTSCMTYSSDGMQNLYNDTHRLSRIYNNNIIVKRCVDLIAQNASSVNIKLLRNSHTQIFQHWVVSLLERPNISLSKYGFWNQLYSYFLVYGNVFIHKIYSSDYRVSGLEFFHPSQIELLKNQQGQHIGYRYRATNGSSKIFRYNREGKIDNFLHIKNFNPEDVLWGVSPMTASSIAIDIHNDSNSWNRSLLANGARPSGALIVTRDYPMSKYEFDQLKENFDASYSGSAKAGRPLLLEGGIDWKDMGLTPRDMDYIETKNAAAREIALSFGVPPQLLGLPGDNKYANFTEARIFLWEQTILPLISNVLDNLSNFLLYDDSLAFGFVPDEIPALIDKRKDYWNVIKDLDFISNNEKRQIFGFPPVA